MKNRDDERYQKGGEAVFVIKAPVVNPIQVFIAPPDISQYLIENIPDVIEVVQTTVNGAINNHNTDVNQEVVYNSDSVRTLLSLVEGILNNRPYQSPIQTSSNFIRFEFIQPPVDFALEKRDIAVRAIRFLFRTNERFRIDVIESDYYITISKLWETNSSFVRHFKFCFTYFPTENGGVMYSAYLYPQFH